MNRHYLFFCSLAYAYPILRPLQAEIWRRGDDVAWYLEEECPDMLMDGEKRLSTVEEVMSYNPIAVFAPGNWIYDFFPGVKVSVFHGYPINKRGDKVDDHFKLRGWFDIYCTQGPSSTQYFKKLEAQYNYFKVYETGWCKADSFFSPEIVKITTSVNDGRNHIPTIFVATTFSKNISSLHIFLPEIKRLAKSRNWRWLITLHPKFKDEAVMEEYRQLAAECENVEFLPVLEKVENIAHTDVMLCDSSSIIIEYMFLNKPVVTLNNTFPGPYLINVKDPAEIEAALEKALTRPAELMREMNDYTMFHEPHRDGHCSARVLDAVDDFILNYKGRLKRKPLNLIRKLKLRWKFKFFRW